MKKHKSIVLLLAVMLFTVLFAVSAFAAVDLTGAYFYGETYSGNEAKDPLTYKVGETMTFKISLKASDGTLLSVPYFSYTIKSEDGVSLSGKESGEGGILTLNHKISCPGFVRLTVKALDETGAEIKSSVQFNGGACAEWEKIEPAMAEPDDFDEFWARSIAELDNVAPDICGIKTLVDNDYHTVYAIYVNCVGREDFAKYGAKDTTYMAGKLSVPKAVPEGGFKLKLIFQGAGVTDVSNPSYNANYVTLGVCCHSMEMGQDSSYYKAMRDVFEGYLNIEEINNTADGNYMKYMVLRDLQAVRFLKKYLGKTGGTATANGIDVSAWKNTWNGTDIEVSGGSQGGFQSIAMAALDHDITLCTPDIVGSCDFDANVYYPNRPTIPRNETFYARKYFDSVALARSVICRTDVSTGFGDDRCPPVGVVAMYNSLNCEKTLTVYQGRTHSNGTAYATGVPKQSYTSYTPANSVRVETEYVIGASGDIFNGMAKAIKTRTNNELVSVESASGIADSATVYYVISDFDGSCDMTAAEMYAAFTASGADYLVFIPGNVTNAATVDALTSFSAYSDAYVCADVNMTDAYEAGRAAGNNITTIIEKNRPVIDGGFRVYDTLSGAEITEEYVLSNGMQIKPVVVLNNLYSNRTVTLTAEGITFENGVLTGDADGGKLIANETEYTLLSSASARGEFEGGSYIIDGNGKLIISVKGDIDLESYPWASHAGSITEIEIKTGAKKIGSGAFSGFTGLTKITFPYTVTEIAADAISGAVSYTACGYENNTAVTAFAGDKFVSLGARGYAGENLIWDFVAEEKTLYIRGTGTTVSSGVKKWDGYNESPWYPYFNSIEKIVLSDSITTIGSAYCFSYMSALKYIKASKNLTYIGSSAFEGSGKLSAFYVSDEAFCEGTLDLSYVTNLSGAYQFTGCKGFERVIFSENLSTPIGTSFFGSNGNITAITLPKNVPSVDANAFKSMTGVRELTVLGRNTVIPENLNISGLTSVKGREGSTAWSFANAKNIPFTDITGDRYDGDVVLEGEVGENVYFKVVTNGASGTHTLYFYGTGTTIVKGDTAPWADYSDSIVKAVFRDRIGSVGAYTLEGLSSLTAVDIDESAITSICSNAFSGTGIEGRFEVPEKIINIESNAFSGCTSLTEVEIPGDEITIAADAFADTGLTTVYGVVGSGSESFAETAGLTFVDINEIIPIASGACKTGNYTWVLDSTGTLTIGGIGNGVLEFDTAITENNFSDIPWYSYRNDILKVVIAEETGITKLASYSLSNLANCSTVIIPTTLTDLSAEGIFANDPSLATVALQSAEETAGVIDLRAITDFSGNLFAGSLANVTPKIYLAQSLTGLDVSGWAEDCEKLTLVTYPTCTTATYIRSVAKVRTNIAIGYYSKAEAPELVRSGAEYAGADTAKYSWIFDDATGTVKFSAGSSAELYANKNTSAFEAWKTIWKDAIVHIDVHPISKLQVNGAKSLFANLSNLETVKFNQDSITWAMHYMSGGLFENCFSLTTIGFGDGYIDGLIDLSCVSNVTGDYQSKIFYNCSSITSVRMRDTAPSGNGTSNMKTMIVSNMFYGCTSLRSIEIPSWVTAVGANAFAGCTSLTSVTLNSLPTVSNKNAFPDNEGQNLYIICPDKETADSINALGYTYTKALFLGNLAKAIAFEGYSVRLKSYNGLRSLFSFDNTKKAVNAENGYSLREYGAILMSGENYVKYGRELTLVGDEYQTANAAVQKLPIYIGEERVGNILSASTKETTRFAVALVNYKDNFTTDVYFCGYEIWTAGGMDFIVYTEFENEELRETNLYDISIGMYRDGLINAKNDAEGIVWDILVNNGAVTLTAGTDYNAVEGQTDLDGNPIGDTFLFADVPAVKLSGGSSAPTITKSETVTITLLRDGDNYVAVYRGTGAIPTTTNGWNYVPQLSSGFVSQSAVPNPKMKATTAAKIKYYVIDAGITSVGNGALSQLGAMQQLVYSEDLKTLGTNMFIYNGSFKTAYMADVMNPEFNPSDCNGIIDFSSLDSLNISSLLVASGAVEYLHLPANIGTDSGHIFNQCTALKAVWCGDAEKPADGTVDFRGSNVKALGSSSFNKVTDITTLKLPSVPFTFTSTKIGESGIKTIYTDTYIESVKTFADSIGITYTHG